MPPARNTTPDHRRGYLRGKIQRERLAEQGASHRPRHRPDARCEAGTFRAGHELSAVANHAVNLTVDV